MGRVRPDFVVWLLIFAPFVALASTWVGRPWTPVQDQAVLDVRLTAIGDGHLPLVGAFSRYGWSHPGPTWFYVLAPFRLLGGTPAWSVVGSVLAFGAGFATTAWLAMRRFGWATCAAATLGLVLLLRVADTWTVVLPWNPHLALAWFPVLLVLCTSAVTRRPHDLLPGLVLGSLLVQLHAGYVVLVGISMGAAISLVLLDHRRSALTKARRSIATDRRLQAWAVALAAVWAPPIIEQVVNGRDGNMALLARFFLDPPPDVGVAAGPGFAAGALGNSSAIAWQPVVGGGERVEPFLGWIEPGPVAPLLGLVALLAAAAVVAARRNDCDGLRASAVAGAGLSAGFVALARVVGDRWPYLFLWRYALVGFTLVVGVAVIGRAVAERTRRLRRRDGTRGGPLAKGAIVTAAALLSLLLTGAPTDPLMPAEAEAEELAAERLAHPRPPSPTTLVRFGGILGGVGDGVLLRATDAGWPVFVVPELEFKHGPGTARPPDAGPTVLFVTEDSIATTLAMSVSGAETLASTTPLGADQERELVSLQERGIQLLSQAGREDLVAVLGYPELADVVLAEEGVDVPAQLVRRLMALNSLVDSSGRCRCAVVRVPSQTPFDLPAAASTV